MDRDEILAEIYEKWGEYLEMSDTPLETIINILINTIIEQNNTITYLRRVNNVSSNTTK
jgi:hypothetical protein